MRKIALLLCLCAIASVASAELLVNGDFEGAGAGWNQWWGGNSNDNAPDPIEGDKCGGIWWSDDGIYQSITIGPGTYTVSGMLEQDNLGNNRIGVIQAEVGDGVNVWWVQQIVIDQTDPAATWMSGNTIIDNTTAGATKLNINLFMIDQNGPHTGAGVVRFDNISVVPEPATMALLALGGLLIRRK